MFRFGIPPSWQGQGQRWVHESEVDAMITQTACQFTCNSTLENINVNLIRDVRTKLPKRIRDYPVNHITFGRPIDSYEYDVTLLDVIVKDVIIFEKKCID